MANNNNNHNGFWNDQVWKSVDDGVLNAVGAIRVARKVFPTTQLSGSSVPADVFNPETMSIADGLTRPYVEFSARFVLTYGQVNEDPTGATMITLSKLAARSLALAEEIITWQGRNGALPSTVQIESGAESIGDGILGLVHDRTIVVEPPDPGTPTNSGGPILAAIAKAIALETEYLMAPPWALVAGTNAYAAIWGSVINGAPAYTVLSPVLTGGIYGTGAMPAHHALFISLGGEPTSIYCCNDPVTEPTQKEKSGQYSFRIFERVQHVARDHRAFVKLDFKHLASSEYATRGSRKTQASSEK
jgi:hypothetical protein